jgi:hypothetical protein
METSTMSRPTKLGPAESGELLRRTRVSVARAFGVERAGGDKIAAARTASESIGA